jgi:phage terminase Nu1 subunit (DNA packaging protein)
MVNLDSPIRQADFGALVGITQPAVSDLVSRGVLEDGQPLRKWLLAYCGRLREQAAGRMGATEGGLDLAQERAALARSQREGIDLKNAVLRGDYAAVELLSETLATASQAVAERFEHLPGEVRKACPDLPPAAADQVMAVIASARNQWVRATAALVVASLDDADDDTLEQIGLEDEPRAD